MIKFIKNFGLKNWLIVYAIILSLFVAVFIVIGAVNLATSTTIVVDASDYIKEELQGSRQRTKALDLQFNGIYMELVQSYAQIEKLKSQIKDRNVAISILRKELKNGKDINTNGLTDVQHDSLFTNLIEGLD